MSAMFFRAPPSDEGMGRDIAALIVPPLITATTILAILVTAHTLAGTPEIAATIAVPFTVSTSYAILYNLRPLEEPRMAVEDNRRPISQRERGWAKWLTRRAGEERRHAELHLLHQHRVRVARGLVLLRHRRWRRAPATASCCASARRSSASCACSPT